MEALARSNDQFVPPNRCCDVSRRSRDFRARARAQMLDELTAARLEANGDFASADLYRATARVHSKLRERALTVTEAPAIVAGEVVPTTEEAMAAPALWNARDTLKAPDAIALDASLDRLRLLSQRGINVTEMAIDAAASIEAGNSLERMLSHQLALAHKVAFELTDRALGQEDTVEQARLLNVSVRLMDAYQRGLLTLQRLRNGGIQTVTVQHVNVGPGAQAIVGNVQTRGCPAQGEEPNVE